MPARVPAYAPPSRRPAEPRTIRRPPRISAPAQSPASPSTTSSPSRMPAPVCGARVARERQAAAGHARAQAATRRGRPRRGRRRLPAPETSNSSPSGARRLPCQSSSALDLRAAQRGEPVRGAAPRRRAAPPAPRAASASASRHELLEVEVVLAEAAAVVAGRELPRARRAPPRRGRRASPRAPARGRARRSRSRTPSRRPPAPGCRDLRAQRRAQHVVRRRHQGLVARADLAAAARDPARERQ